MVENWVELMDPNSRHQNTWNSLKEDMVKIHDMVKEAESNKKLDLVLKSLKFRNECIV
jgi:hypothetical protein